LWEKVAAEGCRMRGSIDRKRTLIRLRGVYHRAALRADPLAKPPSPARGEGKKSRDDVIVFFDDEFFLVDDAEKFGRQHCAKRDGG
jgi:hypothetical protein